MAARTTTFPQNVDSLASALWKHNSPKPPQGKPSPKRSRSTRPSNSPVPAITLGTRRTRSTRRRHRATKYRDHSRRRTRIPLKQLPRPEAWIAALLPWTILHTYTVLYHVTQGGRLRATIAQISARRGLCERGVQMHIAFMELCLVLRVIENRVGYDWNEPNTFIFLNINLFDAISTRHNCTLSVAAFKTSSIYTQSVPRRGKEKAKSNFQLKWEADHAENHPYKVRADWYERRKQRRIRNCCPEVRHAYIERGRRWEWQRQNPDHELIQRLAMLNRNLVGVYDPTGAIRAAAIEQVMRRTRKPKWWASFDPDSPANKTLVEVIAEMRPTAGAKPMTAHIAREQRQTAVEGELSKLGDPDPS